MGPRKYARPFGVGAAWLGALVACAPAAGPGATTPGVVTSAAPAIEAGPPTSSAGTPYRFENVTILGGGFVTGTVFSPAQKGVLYARTDVGGLYRFDQQNQKWLPLTDHLERSTNLLGIESVAPDPVDPNKVYVAAGTYTQSWAPNGAILRSKDQGATWESTEMTIKMGANEDGRSNGERLAVDPNQTEILYFGSRRNGLWKSEDEAVTWRKVVSFPVSEDPEALGIPFVVFDPKSGAPGKPTPVIYAGVSRVSDASLYQSRDAGATWKPVPKQPQKLMPSHAALDGAGTLYVSYGDKPGPSDVMTGAVFKYEPRAQRWTDITPAKPNPAEKDTFGYGGLAVDVQRPGTLLVTTIDRWTKGDETYRSTDGGKTWKALFGKASWDIMGAQYLYWHREKLGPPHWIGDIDIDPFDSAHATFITGAGLWRSTDVTRADADQGTHWKFQVKGLEETVVGVLVSPPAGAELLSGMGDICGFRHDNVNQPPAGGMFSNPIFNATTGMDFAEQKPEVVVRVGTVWGEGQHGGFSRDGGKSWQPFPSEPTSADTGGAVTISADAASVLWVIKKEVPVVSSDFGATWKPAAGLPVPVASDSWVVVNLRPAADRVNPKKLYVYDSAGGGFFASSDGGLGFEKTVSDLPGLPEYQRSSGSIRTVPGFEGHVWLSTAKELMRSVDSGKSFVPVSAVEVSHAVGFGKPAPDRKYPAVYLIGKVGGTEGFFRSDDIGNSWVRINDDKHQFGFTGVITGDPKKFGRVYIGTGGRGILYGDPSN